MTLLLPLTCLLLPRCRLPARGKAQWSEAERTFAERRQQARVDLAQSPGGGLGLQKNGQAPREAHVGEGRALGIVVVDEDDVQVGGVAQLLAAELAVGNDGEARVLAVPFLRLEPALLERDGERAVGQLDQVVG